MRMLAAHGGKRVPGLLKALPPRKPFVLVATPADPEPITIERAKTLSDSYFIHGHVGAAAVVEWFRFITIIRDPRNVLVSYLRWTHKEGKPRAPIDLVDAMDHFFRRPFQQVYRGFLDWRVQGEVVRYEDLTAENLPTTVQLYSGAAQDRDTWTKAPSDWRDWWTERVERKWRSIGGPALVTEAGYPEHDYPIANGGALRAILQRIRVG